MEQTPQPGDRQKKPLKDKFGVSHPENTAGTHADPEKHVVPSEKKIDISDEDRALDSGI